MTTDENSASVRSFGFRAPRVSTNFSFYLEVIATGERCQAVCTNISEDGLAAELPVSLAPATEVIMRTLLPGGTMPLEIRGSVEYGQDGHYGLNFLYSSPEERKEIQVFIQTIS